MSAPNSIRRTILADCFASLVGRSRIVEIPKTREAACKDIAGVALPVPAPAIAGESPPLLIRLGAGNPDDALPLRDIVDDIATELFRSHFHCDRTLARPLIEHVRPPDDCRDLGVEAPHNVRGRALGGHHAKPDHRFVSRDARLGTLGSTDERTLPVVASALTLPSFANSLMVVTASNIMSTCPSSVSVRACELPLYGMCTMSSPAIALNSSPAM